MRIEYTIPELVKIIKTDKRENQITACVPPCKEIAIFVQHTFCLRKSD